MIAPPGDPVSEVERLNASGGMLETSLGEVALPGGMRVRLEQHVRRSAAQGNATQSILFDVGQSSGFSSLSGSVPCFARHGTVWSTEQGRPFLAKEHLLSLG